MQGLFDRFDGNFYPCRASVTAGTAKVFKRLLCDRPAILAITIPPENDDKPFFDDSRDDNVGDVNNPQEKVGYLNTCINTLHLAEKTDNPVTVTTLVMKGMIVILEKAVRDLIQFDTPDKLLIGAGKIQVICADIFENDITLKIVCIRLNPVKQGGMKLLRNFYFCRQEILRHHGR